MEDQPARWKDVLKDWGWGVGTEEWDARIVSVIAFWGDFVSRVFCFVFLVEFLWNEPAYLLGLVFVRVCLVGNVSCWRGGGFMSLDWSGMDKVADCVRKPQAPVTV